MDEERYIIEQYDSLKNNILARLQDVKAERDKVRSEYEDLNTSFKTLYDKLIDKQDENERLRKLNAELEIRNTELQYQLETSEKNRSKLQEKFDSIMSMMKESESQKINVEKFNEEQTCLDPDVEDALDQIDRSRNKDLRDDEIEDIESMKGIPFSTQFDNQEYAVPEANPCNNRMNLSTECNEWLQQFHGTPSPKNRKKRQTNGVITTPGNVNVEETKPKLIIPETVDDNIFIGSDFEKTPDRKLNRNMDMSPIFMNLSNRKRRGSYSSEGNEIGSSVLMSPIRLVPSRLLLKPIQETSKLSSPVKRTSSAITNQSTPEKPKIPKRSQKSPRQRTPKKSPRQKTPKKSPARLSQLKKTNLIEIEMAQNGQLRKLKQTKLDVSTFRAKKVSEKENSLDKDEEIFQQALNDSYDKILEAEKGTGIDDVDVIMESPKRSQTNSSLNFNKKPQMAVAGSSKDASQTLLICDPEATYVSNSFMMNWKMERPNLDEMVEEKMPKKIDLSQTEKMPSPNNSPPFAYKREAVRKKSERLKLPGQLCHECDGYYKATYGDNIPPKELQKILDRCSRHRDKHPDINNTPPGYWKPYFTMTSSEIDKSDY